MPIYGFGKLPSHFVLTSPFIRPHRRTWLVSNIVTIINNDWNASKFPEFLQGNAHCGCRQWCKRCPDRFGHFIFGKYKRSPSRFISNYCLDVVCIQRCPQIGRESCRERVCQYVWIKVAAESLKT